MIFDIAKTNVFEIRETKRSDGYGLRVKREQLQLGTATYGSNERRLILDSRFDLGHGLAKLLGLRFEYV